MATTKIMMTFMIVFCSFMVTSQTFVLNGSTYIGKTKKQIDKINRDNNSNPQATDKSGPLTQIVYYDSINSLTHHFVFARKFRLGRLKCFSYVVVVDGKPQYEKIKSELLTKCSAKISDMRSLQISGSKQYVWHYTSSDESKLYTFVVEKHFKGRNYEPLPNH